MLRNASPCESDHRCTPRGWNVASQKFDIEFTTARQALPWRAAAVWSAIVGLAVFFGLLIVGGSL
jgi:hypothetical protein